MPIGRAGHFGDFWGMDEGDISVSNCYIIPSGSWRDITREDLKILDFISPDIGPDPD